MFKRLIPLFLCVILLLQPIAPPVAEAAGEAGTSRALFLYGDKYAYPFGSLGLTPRNDAQLMADALWMADIKSAVSGAPANLNQLKDMISRAYKGATQEDTSYFYYSGHGATLNGQACLILSDGVANVYVTATELEELLRQVPGKKIVIIDACHSGGMMGKSQDYDYSNKNDAIFTQSIAAPFRQSLYRVITASAYSEFAWSGYQYSDFTLALATGLGAAGGSVLADLNGDSRISINELRSYMRQASISATMQTYPESSAEALFSYANAQQVPLLNNFNVQQEVLDAGGDYKLTMTFSLSSSANVEFSLYSTDDYGADKKLRSEKAYLSRGNQTFHYYVDRTLEPGAYMVRCMLLDGSASYWHTFDIVGSVEPSILLTTRSASLEVDGSQELDIRLGFDSGCSISLAVFNAEGLKVRTLAEEERARPLNNPTAGNPLHYNQYFWDGRSDAGHLLPEGRYTIRGTASVNGSVALEEVLVQLITPTPRINLSVQEVFTLQKEGQLPISLHINTEGAVTAEIRSDRGLVRRIYTERTLGVASHKLRWNGQDEDGYTVPAGEYTVRVALKVNGELRTAEKAFTLEGDNRIVGRAAVSYVPGAGKDSTVDLTMRRAGTLSVHITDLDGNIIRTIMQDRERPKGAYTFEWSVTDAKGAPLAPGQYRLRFEAKSGDIVSPPITRRFVILNNNG